MNTVERVKTICKERKIPISRLEKDLKFANGYIGQLRKGTFPFDRLIQISEYLNVPIEELAELEFSIKDTGTLQQIDRIKELCSKQGITISQLEKELGYGNGSLSKSKSIKAERLNEIAQYFNTSMEYILTGEQTSYYLDPETAQLAQELYQRPEMKVLFDASRKATKEDIEAVAELLKKLSK